ncbi:MAG TPA: M48 family metallopeptidase [Stellaceae bacterium]|nr:M48 family metallopeptidase [Stellaceae bacterium]
MPDFLASYVDGVSAARRRVRASVGEHGIALAKAEGGYITTWSYDEISLVQDEGSRGPLRLARDLARLTVDDPDFPAALYAAAPRLRPGTPSRRLPGALAAIAVSVGTVAALGLALPWLTEGAVALIPIAAEERLGDREVADLQILGEPCVNAAGQAALDRLVDRLTAHAGLPFHAKVVVESVEIVNAFAFPGGRIVVLRGLLDESKSADELAGVLAHELTHASKRHALRHQMASAGIGVLAEMVLGYSTTGDLGAFIAELTYSRSEEAEADAGALVLLREAGISSAGFADFFERLSHTTEASIPTYLSNHPSPADRLAAVRAGAVEGTTPALAPTDWNALKRICADAPPSNVTPSRRKRS